MNGMLCTIISLVALAVCFLLGKRTGNKVTQMKVNAIVDEANRKVEAEAISVECDLKELAKKLVSETPDTMNVTSGDGLADSAKRLLELARGIGR